MGASLGLNAAKAHIYNSHNEENQKYLSLKSNLSKSGLREDERAVYQLIGKADA